MKRFSFWSSMFYFCRLKQNDEKKKKKFISSSINSKKNNSNRKNMLNVYEHVSNSKVLIGLKIVCLHFILLKFFFQMILSIDFRKSNKSWNNHWISSIMHISSLFIEWNRCTLLRLFHSCYTRFSHAQFQYNYLLRSSVFGHFLFACIVFRKRSHSLWSIS